MQRALRLADAKAVEAKAARIKDWVTNKLRELEEQNAHLKVQNAKANDQMELLRNRLEQLQELGATTKSRQTSMIEVMKFSFFFFLHISFFLGSNFFFCYKWLLKQERTRQYIKRNECLDLAQDENVKKNSEM